MQLDTRVQLKSLWAKAFRLMTKDSMMHYSTWGRWYSTRTPGLQYFSIHPRISIWRWSLPYTATQPQFFSPQIVTLNICSQSFPEQEKYFDRFWCKMSTAWHFLQRYTNKYLKIFPHTENPTLCLGEQITETSPLNKLLIFKKTAMAYYLSSNCQDTANCNSFRRQSICWRSPKSFPVFKNKSSVNSVALHNCPKQPTREVQAH